MISDINANLIQLSISGESKCGSCKKTLSQVMRCGACRLEFYCGRDCQKAHWPQHKRVCQIQLKKKTSKEKELTNTISEKKTDLFTSDVNLIEKSMPIPGLRLIENFISDEMHDRFVKEMDKGIPEQNHGHYDGYDFEDSQAFDQVFYPLVKDVFAKLKKFDIFSSETKPLKLSCTLIGYEKNGFITRHIDSPLLSGGTVVVISFNSPVVINFYSEKKKTTQQIHKIFIPPKSMYTITGEARHEWSHEILPDEDTYLSEKFNRQRRYVILFTPPGPLRMSTELLDY